MFDCKSQVAFTPGPRSHSVLLGLGSAGAARLQPEEARVGSWSSFFGKLSWGSPRGFSPSTQVIWTWVWLSWAELSIRSPTLAMPFVTNSFLVTSTEARSYVRSVLAPFGSRCPLLPYQLGKLMRTGASGPCACAAIIAPPTVLRWRPVETVSAFRREEDGGVQTWRHIMQSCGAVAKSLFQSNGPVLRHSIGPMKLPNHIPRLDKRIRWLLKGLKGNPLPKTKDGAFLESARRHGQRLGQAWASCCYFPL